MAIRTCSTAVRLLFCAGPLLAAAACGVAGSREDGAGPSSAAPVVVTEAFLTPPSTADANIDSVAIWRRGSPALLIATAKTGNTLPVYDATTGQYLRSIGEPGPGPGQMQRPNGILVLDDLAFVVERDNHRLQVFALPEGKALLTFGSGELRRPYGIAGYADGDGYVLFVTDNYEHPDGTYPPDSALDRRVHRFRVTKRSTGLDATHETAFGDTSGPGVLRKVETIGVDREYQRLLVAEEDAAVRELRVYSPEGRYMDQSIAGFFATEPEGVALIECGEEGYWLATDQHEETAKNVFHVFDRRTLAHRGAFRGATTHTTDGVVMSMGTLGALQGGVFYALHNDEQVAAFEWEAIAKALRLEPCAAK